MHLTIAFDDPDAAAQAMESLALYGQLPCDEPFANRIHLAIIALSGGNLLRLRELVMEAKSDFREVLFRAQSLAGWGAILQ